MKKSILALGALAVVGGLGLAGSAQAVYYFGTGYESVAAVPTLAATRPAVQLELNPGGTGHSLVVPYYSVQNNTTTVFTIVNTDNLNGKAVKVRFRGAANSDDVLDFTLLLSPSDVWQGQLRQNANGLAELVSNDRSCSLPTGPYNGTNAVPFKTDRLKSELVLNSYLTADQQAQNTREGYIEILNMADIPPNRIAIPTANPLYTAIKHAGGVPPCTAAAINPLLNTQTVTTALALLDTYGLAAPTGQLAGGWVLLNQTSRASFSGNTTAARAYNQPAGPGALGLTGTAWVAFSPQASNDSGPVVFASGGVTAMSAVGPNVPTLNAVYPINALTADPLLTGGTDAVLGVGPFAAVTPQLTPYWVDLPDLSTPMGLGLAAAVGNPSMNAVGATLDWPTPQAEALAQVTAKTRVHGEFWNDPTGVVLGVTSHTDWVLSQPTRRYFAVVDYNSTALTSRAIFNNNVISGTVAAPGLPYAGIGTGANILLLSRDAAFGPQLCLRPGTIGYSMYDQEETGGGGAIFSPGTTPAFCGEVATVTWGTSLANAVSSIGGTITNTRVATNRAIGWIDFAIGNGTGPGYGLPMSGYSAIGIQGSGQAYGVTYPLRW